MRGLKILSWFIDVFICLTEVQENSTILSSPKSWILFNYQEFTKLSADNVLDEKQGSQDRTFVVHIVDCNDYFPAFNIGS